MYIYFLFSLCVIVFLPCAKNLLKTKISFISENRQDYLQLKDADVYFNIAQSLAHARHS